MQEQIMEVLENGAIIVVDDDDKYILFPFFKKNFFPVLKTLLSRSVEQYFLEFEDKGYVNFISSITNNQQKSLLKLTLGYQEVFLIRL